MCLYGGDKFLKPKANKNFHRRTGTLYYYSYKGTVEELIDTIKLIKSTDFKVEDVNTDLHKRVQAAVAKGHFTRRNMRESSLDGNQDLTFWLRSCLETGEWTVTSIFSFEMIANEVGEREFSASNSAVSFQIAQVRGGPDCVSVSLMIYIDGSFIKHGIPVQFLSNQYTVNLKLI